MANPTTTIAAFNQPRAQANEDGVENAEFSDINPHADLSEEGKDALKKYIANLSQWKQNDPAFVGDAIRVEESLKERLELMSIISNNAALDHHHLAPYRAYIIADRAALAQPDRAEEAYEKFQERRDNLRDSLELETLRISASEYKDLTVNIQNVMLNQAHIGLHRDFVDIRKEVAQENAMHPRFIAEVATAKGSLFDELLVDLDRGDLRNTNHNMDGTTSQPWIEDSKIRAELFSEAVAERENIGDANSTSRIQKFGKMIAIGKQIIHDPLAIKEFAEHQKDVVAAERRREIAMGHVQETPEVKAARAEEFKQIGGKNYEIGMAALENKKFSPEMSLSFFQSIDYGAHLDPKDRIAIFGKDTMVSDKGKTIPSMKGIGKVAKDPVAMFLAANAAFRGQFDAGDAKAGLSYSVMEYTAQQIMNDPIAIRGIAEIDLDAAQAIEQFRPQNRQGLLQKEGGQNFEDKVHAKLNNQGNLVKESSFSFSGTQITEQGEINLDEALKPKMAEMMAVVGDDGSITLAASQKGYDAGDTFTLKGPFEKEGFEKSKSEEEEFDTGLINFGEGHKKGDRVPVYVEFQEDGAVLLAKSKEEMAGGNFTVINDAFDNKGGPTTRKANQMMAPGSVGQESIDSMKGMIARDGPHIHVLEGGKVVIAATEADYEAGRGVPFSLYGIKAPPPGKDHATKDDAFDAGYESKKHLEDLLTRYGKRGLTLETVDGRDGQKEIRMRMNSGEDMSYRMIRDGYALPSECETMRGRREEAAQIADRGNMGLWAHGFPDDDGSWRSESLMPHLTRKDKRENLKRTVQRAMAGSPMGAQRVFSDKSAELFALEVGAKWEHPGFYREAWEAVQANPDRMKKLYTNNVKLMKELKARKDNMSEEEKTSHDQLTIGARLIGRALVNVGEKVDPKTGKKSWKYVSPMEVMKDTDTLLSKRGLAIPQTIKDTFSKGTEAAGQAAKWGLENSSQFANYVLGVGRDLT